MSEKIAPYEEKMVKSIHALETELNTIRAGRANPHVLDKIMVEHYGAQNPINALGNIAVPEARMITITPWDTSALKSIEKAIQSSDLGINPSSDGKVIRLVFPELTEERRKTLTKDVKKKAEESKIAIRNIRRDAVDSFKKIQKKGEISEDGLKDLEDELQNLTDKKIVEIDKIADSKCKEILSI